MEIADLYIRVSTDEQAEKGYSLRSQEEVLRKYCELNNITIRKVISEDYTARTFNRPEWKKYLADLRKSRGKVNKLLFIKWDRFSRITSDAYQMIATLRKFGVEPQATEQPLDLSIPENKIMLAFYLAMPEAENERRALNVIDVMRKAKKEGRYMGMAPFGYVNRTTENGKKYIAVHPDQANVIRWIFKEISKGKYNAEQIFKMARKRGFTKQRAFFYKLIRNRVYCGKIFVSAYKDEPGEYVKGLHEPIISEALFFSAQDVLDNRRRHYNLKVVADKSLPLRGFINCPLCGKVLSGSASKGYSKYYTYYHCHSGCKFRIRAEEVNDQFLSQLKKYIPDPVMLPVFKRLLMEAWQQQTGSMLDDKKKLQQELKILQEKLDYAQELLLSREIDSSDYHKMKAKYTLELDKLQARLRTAEDDNPDIKKLLNSGLERLLSIDYIYENGDNTKKQEVITAIFSKKLEIENNQLRTDCTNEVVRLIYLINKELDKNKNGQNGNSSILSTQVRKRRFELPCPFGHNDLNVARLPVSPPPRIPFFRSGANFRYFNDYNKFYTEF